MQDSKPGEKLFAPAAVCFLVLFFVFLIVGKEKLLADPGVYWHLKFGQVMLAEGQVISSDRWTFTENGEPWRPMSWLNDLLFAVLYSISGFDTMLLSTVTIIAGIYAWIYARILKAGATPILGGLILSLCIAACSHHFHTRPHMLSLLFFTITFIFIFDIDQNRKPYWLLYFLIPLYIIWTNIHAGVLIGILAVGFAHFLWAVTGNLKRVTQIQSNACYPVVAGFLVLLGLTIFVNPFGYKLQVTWFSLVGSDVLPKVIQEHRPLRPSAAQPEGFFIVLVMAFYVVSLVSARSKKMPLSWFFALPWLILGITSIRHCTFFALAASVCIADILPHARWNRWLEKHNSKLLFVKKPDEEQPTNYLALILPALLVTTVFTLQALQVNLPVIGSNWASPNPSFAPLDFNEQIAEIVNNNEQPVKIINDMKYGGYLILWHPDTRLFIDDRCSLHGDERLLEYFNAANFNPEIIDQWAQEHQVNYALLQNQLPLSEYCKQSKDWELIQESEQTSLFRRKSASDLPSDHPKSVMHRNEN